MEGKETRFGIAGSVLTAVTTSNTATGSTNACHDSFTQLGGAVPLFNMSLGEIVFGGLGTGLYSIVLMALIGIFLTGLMIGRTPEYMGKQLGPAEMKLIMLYTLVMPAAILLPTALAVILPAGLAGLATNTGAHGFTEILYAYTSSVANNGQTFAGLNGNLPFYNYSTIIAMLAGRFLLAIPALALAGKFAAQGRRAGSARHDAGNAAYGYPALRHDFCGYSVARDRPQFPARLCARAYRRAYRDDTLMPESWQSQPLLCLD